MKDITLNFIMFWKGKNLNFKNIMLQLFNKHNDHPDLESKIDNYIKYMTTLTTKHDEDMIRMYHSVYWDSKNWSEYFKHAKSVINKDELQYDDWLLDLREEINIANDHLTLFNERDSVINEFNQFSYENFLDIII